jgi:hypothetical protein
LIVSARWVLVDLARTLSMLGPGLANIDLKAGRVEQATGLLGGRQGWLLRRGQRFRLLVHNIRYG